MAELAAPAAPRALDAPWLREAWQALPGLRARGAHAVLLHGAAGIGKKQLALDYAGALLCESPQAGGVACGHCAGCRLQAAGNHPDLRVVVPDTLAHLRPVPSAEEVEDAGAPAEPNDEAAGERKEKRVSREIRIEQVRELLDFVNMASHRAGARVVVLAPAETITEAAANALLKMLEEPLPGTVFVLAADAFDKVLPTIRSRCVLLRVAAPSWEDAAKWLRARGVADADERLAAAGGAPWLALAEEGAGRLDDALRALLLDFLAKGPRLGADELAARLPRVAEVGAALAMMQRWGWDLLAARSAGGVRYHRAQERAVKSLAAAASTAAVLEWLADLARQRRNADHPLNPKLALESALLGYIGLWRSAPARS